MTEEHAELEAAERETAEREAAELEAAAAVAGQEDQETAFGWAYLAFLFAVFLVLALMAYSCDDDNSGSALTETVGTTATTVDASAGDADADLTPIGLTATVLDGQVTLSGAVPDEAARTQILQIAEARYGAGNVVDEMTIDAGTTIKGGTIAVVGSTIEGDELPGMLAADFGSSVGLTADAEGVVMNELVLTPFAATAAVDLDKVTLAGEMPGQDSIDALVTAANDQWGADNVDASGLSIGENLTSEAGTVTVTGLVDAGDSRGISFATRIAGAGGALAGSTGDASGVEVDTSPAALARAQEALTEALAADPILFASGSAGIDPESDAILERVAAAINATPNVDIEIVGHTDDQGSGAVNTALSTDRAAAVLDRLVELGVDADRLTSSGKGEAEPIADNDTEEGRAANRRIAFLFEGAEA